MILLNSEWQEIQASIKEKDAKIKELEEALAEIFRLADAVFVQRQFSGYTMGNIHALSAKALEAKK